MELYKWYKGDELPDRECDCVVMYSEITGVYGGNYVSRIRKKLGQCVSDEGNYFIVDNNDYWIRGIIAWMPIEFPKEVS